MQPVVRASLFLALFFHPDHLDHNRFRQNNSRYHCVVIYKLISELEQAFLFLWGDKPKIKNGFILIGCGGGGRERRGRDRGRLKGRAAGAGSGFLERAQGRGPVDGVIVRMGEPDGTLVLDGGQRPIGDDVGPAPIVRGIAC